MFTKYCKAPPPPFRRFNVNSPGSYRWCPTGLLVLSLCLFLIGCAGTQSVQTESGASPVNEHWPEVVQNDAYRQLAIESAQEYRAKGLGFRQYLSENDYDPFGDYLNWGENKLGQYHEGENRVFDENGIYMVKYNNGSDEFNYNATTVAQQALSYYGGYLKGMVTKESFLAITAFLLELEEENGSFPNGYDYRYYVDPENYYKAGWTDAMTIGNVLSAFTRAYRLTNDSKYVDGAVRAIAFLNVPIEEGGPYTTLAALDPSLEGYTILEEYPCDPPTYTLNGYMYTLIGLYDWSQTGAEGSDRAKELFNDGIRTLEKILPYYDIGGFTCYDLAHITWNRETPHVSLGYHRVHVAFCKIFYDITGIDTFNHYYTLWASYVAA